MLKNGNSCYETWISPRDLLYNSVYIVNNAVLYTKKVVKSVDILLRVLTTIKFKKN